MRRVCLPLLHGPDVKGLSLSSSPPAPQLLFVKKLNEIEVQETCRRILFGLCRERC